MVGKKIVWIRILKILAVVIPVILFVLYMPVDDDGDTRRIRNFYLEEPDSLDVVLLGASDIYAGYSPAIAYEEYGFTSYPFVLSGNLIHIVPAQLEAVYETQSPELVVIDITELVHWKGNNYDMVFRRFIAGVPLSWQKVRMIYEYGDRDQLLSYYFPFFLYHGSAGLEELYDTAKTDYLIEKRGYSLLKGTYTFTGSGENWDGPYVPPKDTNGDTSRQDIPEQLEPLFHDLLTFCRDRGYTNILFVNYPHRNSTEQHYTRYQISNTVGDLIESYGYDFINLDSMHDKIGIQPETDFYNNDHMNLYGQFKTTRFLCSILVNDYGIEGREQSPANKERWDACAEFNHLYYALFDKEFKARDPEEFGLWLEEDGFLAEKIEQMRYDANPS